MTVPVIMQIDDGDGFLDLIRQEFEFEFQERAEAVAAEGVRLLREVHSVEYVPGSSSAGLYLFYREQNLLNSIGLEITDGQVDWGIIEPGNWFSYWVDPARGARKRKGLEEFLEEFQDQLDEILFGE